MACRQQHQLPGGMLTVTSAVHEVGRHSLLFLLGRTEANGRYWEVSVMTVLHNSSPRVHVAVPVDHNRIAQELSHIRLLDQRPGPAGVDLIVPFFDKHLAQY